MALKSIDTLVSKLETDKADSVKAQEHIRGLFQVFSEIDINSIDESFKPIVWAIQNRLKKPDTNELDITNQNLVEEALRIAYVYQVLQIKIEAKSKLKAEIVKKVTSTLLTVAKNQSVFWSKQKKTFIDILQDPTNQEVVEQKPADNRPIVWNEKLNFLPQVKKFVKSAIEKFQTSKWEEIPPELKEKFFDHFARNYISFCEKRKLGLKMIIETKPIALVTRYGIDSTTSSGVYTTFVPSQKWLEQLIHDTFTSMNLTPEEKKLILDVQIKIVSDSWSSTNRYLMRVFWEQIRAPKKEESKESLAFIQLFKDIKANKKVDTSKFPEEFKEMCFAIIKWVVFNGKDDITIVDKKQKRVINFDKNKDILLNNLLVFIAYTVEIESSFSNSRTPSTSSATGYVQFPNGNFWGVVNLWFVGEDGKLSSSKEVRLSTESLGTAIIRTNSLLWALKSKGEYAEKIANLMNRLRINDKTFGLKTSDLESDEQIMLLLGNIFNMTRETFQVSPSVRKKGTINRWWEIVNVQNYLQQMLVTGSEFYLSRTYGWLHHSSPDEATKWVRTNILMTYRTLLKNAETWAENIVVLYEISNAHLEKIEKNISGKDVQITWPWVEPFLKDFLNLLGYELSKETWEEGWKIISQKTIKELLFDFQSSELIPWANGAFWPATKKRLQEVLIYILRWSFDDVVREKVIQLLEKHFKNNAEIKPVTGTEYSRGTEDIRKIKLNKIPVTVDVKNYVYSDVEMSQIITYYEKNKDKFLKLLNITEKQYSKFFAAAKKQTQKYGMNYSSRVYLYYIKAIEENKLPPFIKDFSMAKAFLEQGKLTTIEDQTDLWRIDTRLWKKEKNEENRVLLKSLTPKTKTVLVEIGKRFQENVAKYGLPWGLKPRMVINSMLRPHSYNTWISWSSELSAHWFWTGFDIAHFEFDLIQGTTFTTTTNKEIWRHNIDNQPNIRLTKDLENILLATLIDFDREWKIILTGELSHPHVTVIQ